MACYYFLHGFCIFPVYKRYNAKYILYPRSKKMKKLIFGLFVFMMAVSTLSAGGKKEIVLWHPLGGVDGSFFEAMVKAYNDTKPEISVKSVVQADQYTKIYTLMNSRNSREIPDLMVYHAERIKLFNEQGFLDSMDDVIAGQPNINAANYVPQAWDAGQIGGRRYAVPLDTHSSLLIYNKELVRRYAPGILDDAVVTFDEMRTVKNSITDPSIITYGLNLRGNVFLALVSQQGGHINSGDRPTINTPEAIAAVTMMKRLVDEGIAQPDGEDPFALVQTGKTVFYQGATWDAGFFNELGLDWAFSTTPVFNPNQLANWSSSHQFGMLKKERSTEIKAGIGQFLEFVRNNPQYWAASGQNPATMKYVSDGMYRSYPQGIAMEGQIKDSLTIYDFLNNGITMDAVNAVLDDMIFGRLDIREGLAKAQKEADDKIAQTK
jgi:multiple sugar transport system substrate-binding protein